MLHEVLAAAVIAVRDDLQKLKHADSGNRADSEKMRTYITAVELTDPLVLPAASARARPDEVLLGRS
jgi:hypothetical protein